jgi:hypothetical protein
MTTTMGLGPGAVATKVVSEGDGETLIINTGPSNVFFGDTNSIQAGDSIGIVPVTPNSYFAVSGDANLFACVAAGTHANLNIISGGLNFFLPVTSLTIPYGATGQRIVINPPTFPGSIVGYDAQGRVEFIISPQGFFLYDPTASGHNLIYSVTAASGTDSLGNVYIGPGVTFYANSGGVQASAINMVSAIAGNGVGNISQYAFSLGSWSQNFAFEYQPTIGFVFNDPIWFGVGNAPGITFQNWATITLPVNWTNRGAGFPTLAARLLASPPNSAQILGEIVSPAGGFANPNVVGTVGPAYRPASEQPISVRLLSGSPTTPPASGFLRGDISVNGDITVRGSASTTQCAFQIFGTYALDH